MNGRAQRESMRKRYLTVVAVFVFLGSLSLQADSVQLTAKDDLTERNREAVSLLDSDLDAARQLALAIVQEAARRGDVRAETLAYRTTGVAYVYENNFRRAGDYFERAHDLAVRNQLDDLMPSLLNNLGVANRYQSDYRKALTYFQQAAELFGESGRPIIRAQALFNAGACYYYMGDYEHAMDKYLEARRIWEDQEHKPGIAMAANGIAVIHDELKEFDAALEGYQQSLKLFTELGDRRGMSDPLNNLGILYYTYLNDLDTALQYHEQALEIRKETGDRLGEAISLNNIGNVYSARGDMDQALSYYLDALNIKEQLGEKAEIAVSLRDIGDVYRSRGEFERAMDYTGRSLEVAREVNARKDVRSALRDLSDISREMGDYRQAYDFRLQYEEIDEALRGEETSRKVAEMIARERLHQQKEQIRVLEREAENRKNLLLVTILAAFLLLLVGQGVYLQSRMRMRLNRSLQDKNRQISAQKEKLETLNRILEDKSREYYVSSITDPLTGVFNRAFIMEVLGRELKRAQRHGDPISVVFLDLDHFKSVNDNHGHAVGDLVLRTIAHRIMQSIRPEDYFGRFGGEEFLLVLPATALDGAVSVVERVRELVSGDPVLAGGVALKVTLSAGITRLVGDRSATAEELIARADAALYRAKENGRNRVETDPAE